MYRTLAALLIPVAVSVAILFLLRAREPRVREVIIDQSEGFADLVFPVAKQRCGSRGDCVVDVAAIYDNQPIGFRLVFASNMKENRFENLNGTGGLFAKTNGIELQLNGQPGQNFVRFLSSAYGIPSESISLPASVSFTAVPLEGDPQQIAGAPLKFKVFHRDDEPEGADYFELHIDPDLPHGIIHFNEKDPDYRKPILRSLGASFP